MAARRIPTVTDDHLHADPSAAPIPVGSPAWFAWLAIHVFFLIGFRNRFLVMTQWAWAYVTYQRGARLITGPVGPLVKD